MTSPERLNEQPIPGEFVWEQHLRDLLESDTIFRQAFENSAIGIALVGTDGRWLHVNNALCEIVGYSDKELHELTFQDITHPDDLDLDLTYVRQMLTGEIRSYQMEKRYFHKNGATIWALLSVSLVRDTRGRQLYFISQIQNITERKRAEAAMRDSETRFRTLFEESPDAVVLVDPHYPGSAWEIVDCNAVTGAMTDYTREELIGRPLDLINPPRPGITNRPARFEQLRREGSIRQEIPIRRKDGTIYPVMISMSLITIDGRDLILAIGRDMTQLKQAETALRDANRELEQRVAELELNMRHMKLLNDTGEWLHACHSIEEAYTVIAHSLAEIAPATAGALYLLDADEHEARLATRWGETQAPVERFDPTECVALRERHVHLAEDGVTSFACNHSRVESAGGTLCIPLMAFGNVIGALQIYIPADRNPGGLTEMQQQIALSIADHGALTLANLQLREALHGQAVRDVLTGLFNRRYMEEALNRELMRAQQNHTTIGVMMFDIDHFKHFNDTYGHLAGDAILRAIAGYLYTRVRSADIACRYGGEEFLVILPGAPLTILLQRAEELLTGVRQVQVIHDGRTLGAITVSIGIALFPTHGADAESLVRAADNALYQAKRAGRNRVILAEPAVA
jgi:diguanylate cyclase (GGDEF)-like protein/PAS domain S-box-containing protein